MLSAEQIARAQIVSIADIAGAALCKTHGRAGVIFTLQPPGVKVRTKHAHAAIMSGALLPARTAFSAAAARRGLQTRQHRHRPCAPALPAHVRF